MVGDQCVQVGQALEVFEELSTPVENLLQPAFLEGWSWLEGELEQSGATTTTAAAAAAAAAAPPPQHQHQYQHQQPQPQPQPQPQHQPQHQHQHQHQPQPLPFGSVSPQFLHVQTPDHSDHKHCDMRRLIEAPPTPGLSLLEQLHMDQPLMDVIANKHKRGYYRCTHCPETFSNIFEYASHMDEYGIKREFKCPFALCPWKILGLPRRPDLRRHCAIQHKDHLPADLKELLNLRDETYPTLQCPHQYCDKVFHRKDAYNRHISIVHEKVGSRFNKRMFQILADCPYEKEADRNRYVKTRMKSRRSSTGGGGSRGSSAGSVTTGVTASSASRRHSIAIAGIR